jgi:predicted DNA-binding protein (MmcQ/YjbR family)
MPTSKPRAPRVRVKPAPTAAPTTKPRSPRSKAKPAPSATPSRHPPKARTAATQRLVERLRTLCLALPDVVEQEAWAEPTWRIGGRIFAQCDTYHHDSPHLAAWLPAPDGAQAALIEAHPAHIFRPPYVGHRGWIAIILDTDVDWALVAQLIGVAYDLIKPAPKAPRARPAGPTRGARRPR